jgi:hypothetical protein
MYTIHWLLKVCIVHKCKKCARELNQFVDIGQTQVIENDESVGAHFACLTAIDGKI